jgi:outer membrane protein OmpA-like peptidoglycan-associated protein
MNQMKWKMKITNLLKKGLFLIILICGCSQKPTEIDRSLVAIRESVESQERSIKMLELMADQARQAESEGKIAESANQEIQSFVVEKKKAVEEQQAKLEETKKEIEDFKEGKGDKTARELLVNAGKRIIENAAVIRIVDRKTAVIVDFLGSETFSKSEIGALFSSGEYRLIAEQINKGEALFMPIIEKIYGFANRHKDAYKSLHAEIIVTGYADANPVEKGSKLYKDLKKRLLEEQQITEHSDADLNLKLSEIRANAVKKFLEKLIEKQAKSGKTLDIEVKVIGRGEEIPKGLPENILKNDRRRRVVTFYWVVLPNF